MRAESGDVPLFEGRFCQYNHHYSKVKRDCKPCENCDEGEALERNCGYDHKGEKIPGKLACKKCPPGYYSRFYEAHGYAGCMKCSRCNGRPKGKRFKRVCRSNADAVCGDCEIGFVSNET